MMKIKVNEWYVGEPGSATEYANALSQGRKNLLSKYDERRINISGKDLPDVLDELYNPGDYVEVYSYPNDFYYTTYKLNDDDTFTYKAYGKFSNEILTYDQARSRIKNSFKNNAVRIYNKK